MAGIANLGVEPHQSLEDVERDARKANAERRKAAKEANEVSVQGGVTSGTAVQDAHQVSKSGGQETAQDGASDSMSVDSKLGSDDEDKSVPDASAQASVGGADVVEPPVGGRVSESPQPEHEVEASDDDEVEYVETKKPQFGPAGDVEVVEVGSDPDDDDDGVELVKVEPAVKKEAHRLKVQEDQVLEDMEVSLLEQLPSDASSRPVATSFASRSPSENIRGRSSAPMGEGCLRKEFPPKHQVRLASGSFGFIVISVCGPD
ncbi:unnamed protein product [Phytophthora fragariaefolia]|uniref:Unnamed protein product n=1 Tax=Phytophthora fragariaefolia TaxID=1490495 RepID=A0A9W6XF82_9STRA|nr:unnamed protein product [Phytophthora fragariaefolia]